MALAADYFPPPDGEGGWRAPPQPEAAGLAAARLDAAYRFVETSTKNGGLLVARRGWLALERYFGRGSRDAMPNTASCGKSYTAIAVGILIAQRPELFPDGLDQKVWTPRYLPPEAFPPSDPRKTEIRLGQLLSMTAGLRGNNPGYVRGKPVTLDPPGPDGWQAMVDATALGGDLWCRPGTGYSYATASIHVASLVLHHVSGMELRDFVARYLAEPLGWGRFEWGYRRPEITHTPGGGGIAPRSTDMLRFAYMLLRKGRWRGRQVVPAEYVAQCGRPSRYNPHYPETLTFENNSDGRIAGVPRDAFWKAGSGGHCFYVIPSLDLAVWKLGGRDDQYGQPPAAQEDPLAATLRLVAAACI
jgi:CubicO group peptidase (beta-lactamase class C family)